jgi:cytochrome c5
MLRCLLPLLVIIGLAACDSRGPETIPEPDSGVSIPEPVSAATLSGVEAYELACAGCHDEGLNGAPKTGDRQAWSGRSWLWEAVLFEHAEGGYLTMPAKGGNAMLDDITVSKAAEYMLTQTFPEAPRD